MTKFDWNLIPSFLAVLEAGSLAGAARSTGISQPTLGRHIDELEAALGVVLFQRGRTGALPTEIAIDLASQAREMQAAFSGIEMTAAGSAVSLSGSVRITASQVVATYVLPPILSQLLEVFSDISVELVSTNSIDNLLQRDADIAVRMVRPSQNDLIARQVNTFKMGVFGHRDYLQKHGIPQIIGDLRNRVVIGYDRSDLIMRGFEAVGHKVDRSFFRYRCDDQVAVIEALAAGVGIGFCPLFVAQRFSQLQRILPDIDIPGLPMWLTAHRELRTSAKIRRVYDFLGDKLAAMEFA